MTRWAAFLRGMNLGGRRITNDELCSAFESLGFEDLSAFLASGNVVFTAGEDDPTGLAEQLETGLRDALGYEVPTFLRTGAEVHAIAAHEPFTEAELERSRGKVQVTLLDAAPGASARDRVLALASDDDRLAFRGRELYWLPSGGISESELDLAAIGKALGRTTMRAQRTVQRMAKKFFSD